MIVSTKIAIGSGLAWLILMLTIKWLAPDTRWTGEGEVLVIGEALHALLSLAQILANFAIVVTFFAIVVALVAGVSKIRANAKN